MALNPELPADRAEKGARTGSGGRATGRGTRIGIAAQVTLTILLALAAVLLLDWLAERPGLRWRVDLTRTEQNTLSPATLGVLEKLPIDARIDVFFAGRALERPYEALGREVQEYTRHVLRLVQDSSQGRVDVVEQDLSDQRGAASPALSRMRELDVPEVEPGGLVVVSSGSRKQVLHLNGDLSDLDPGSPADGLNAPRAPSIVSFRAEEAVVSALHKVAMESEPRVLFTMGHGELDPEKPDVGGAGLLKRALESDGFQVARWDIEKQGPFPPACQIVVVLGPEQPFSESETREIQAFVEAGGRLVAAPDYKTDLAGPGSLAALLDSFGILPNMSGLLARPLAQASGEPLYGVPQCAQIIVWGDGMAAQNPVTESLRRARRRVYIPFARSLTRSNPPPGGTVIPILHTDEAAWNDHGERGDRRLHDWRPTEGEEHGPFLVAMEGLYPTKRPVPPERSTPGGRPESRILCVGSSAAFANELLESNRDFLLNGFNWVSAREYRVNVSAKSPEARRLDVTQGNAMSSITFVAVVLLPGLCLLLGLFTAWKRRH